MTQSSASYPPEVGELWISIHTNKLCRIVQVEDNKVHAEHIDANKMVTGKLTAVLGKFLSDWKRHAKASPWRLGFLQ